MGKLYVNVSQYYIKLMQDGTLKEGDRMPSIRDCAKNLGVSRTTAENAYMSMAEDGYIYSKEKSGFYVTYLAAKRQENKTVEVASDDKAKTVKYDFATIGEDHRTTSLPLWNRYIKSALRQEEKLLTYPSAQGEEDLRQEIANFVRTRRNIICSKEDIVIGAGFQSLMHILLPLLSFSEKTVSVPDFSFQESAKILEDAGFEVSYRNKNANLIYVAPAYMTNYGSVMPLKRRYELVEHGKKGHFIIEDDYQNEYIFSSKPTPSLYALAAGQGVAYLGSFSRVLLPSARISFMILPVELREKYCEQKNYYNQTASKVEQLALAAFLRDGHLLQHMRKNYRLYEAKRNYMEGLLYVNFNEKCEILSGESGMEYVLRFNESGLNVSKLANKLEELQVLAKIYENQKGEIEMLLSCGSLDKELIAEGVKLISVALASIRDKM